MKQKSGNEGERTIYFSELLVLYTIGEKKRDEIAFRSLGGR